MGGAEAGAVVVESMNAGAARSSTGWADSRGKSLRCKWREVLRLAQRRRGFFTGLEAERGDYACNCGLGRREPGQHPRPECGCAVRVDVGRRFPHSQDFALG